MTWQNESAGDRFELDPRRHSDILARDPFYDEEQMEGDGVFEDPEEELEEEDDDDVDEDDDELEDDDDLEEEEEEEDDL